MSKKPIIEYSTTEVRRFARQMDLSTGRQPLRTHTHSTRMSPWPLRLGTIVCLAVLVGGFLAINAARQPDPALVPLAGSDQPVTTDAAEPATTEAAQPRSDVIAGCVTQVTKEGFATDDEMWIVVNSPEGPISGSLQGARFIVCADLYGEVLNSPTLASTAEIIAPDNAPAKVLAIGGRGTEDQKTDQLTWVFGSVNSEVASMEIESQGIRSVATIENGMFGIGLPDASFEDAVITVHSASGDVSTIDSLNCYSAEEVPRLTPRYLTDGKSTGGCTAG